MVTKRAGKSRSWAPSVSAGASTAQERPNEGKRSVRLLAVPLRLLKASEDHFDDLFRELQMAVVFGHLTASTGAATPAVGVAGTRLTKLAAQAERVKGRLADVREPVRRALWEASQGDYLVVDLDLTVDGDLVDVLVSSEKLLRGAARAARAGYLLTEPPGPEVDALRRWLTRELRAQMAGHAARPCPFPAEE